MPAAPNATADPATAVQAATPEPTQAEVAKTEELGGVSSRATQMLASFGGAYYFEGIGRAKEGGLWTKDNPDGYTVLAVAENRQSIDLMQQRLARVAPIPREAFFYDSFQGVERFRKALANLLTATFMKGVDIIRPEHICVASGCGAVLSAMFNLLGEAGDACLIPAPYYPGFDFDTQVERHFNVARLPMSYYPGFDFDTQASAGVKPWPVHCALPGSGDSCIPALAEAATAAKAAGHPPRAVLLCHPNNPIGRSYTAQQLQEMLEWCLANSIHLISDEVYANSTFGAGAQAFTSLALLAQRHIAEHSEAEDRVKAFAHVVFGVSKDYCASGFRVGAVWTQNEAYIKAQSLAGYFGGVSNIVQHALSDLFEDTPWLLGYVAENSRRLGAAYDAIAGALKEAGIPFIEADSTMMIWIDLRKFLEAPTWEAERKLWHRLADEQRVILTPGECCHGAEPGFFRCCYAWMDDTASLPVTVQRIQKCLAQ